MRGPLYALPRADGKRVRSRYGSLCNRERAMELLTAALEIHDVENERGSRATVSGPSWTLDSVSAERRVIRDFAFDPEVFL
jgi:hypothetical protein